MPVRVLYARRRSSTEGWTLYYQGDGGGEGDSDSRRVDSAPSAPASAPAASTQAFSLKHNRLRFTVAARQNDEFFERFSDAEQNLL